LAAEVLEKYLPERVDQTPPFHCIEHYPGTRDHAETFDLVTFDLTVPERHLSTLRLEFSGAVATSSTEERLALGRPQ
jgi:hypothetical protein